MYCYHAGPGSGARYPRVHNIRELGATLSDGEAEGELGVGEVEDLDVRLEILLEVSHAEISLMSSAGYIPETSLLTPVNVHLTGVRNFTLHSRVMRV